MPLPSLDFGYAGKTAMVVGGGRGMGHITSLYLASAGATVAVVDNMPDRAAAVVTEITDGGGQAFSIVGDVTARGESDTMVDKVMQRQQRLDVLINVIGIAHWSPAVDMPDEDWDYDLMINLTYAFRTSRAAARAFIAQQRKGAVVSIASISGEYAGPYHAAYGAGKAGLAGLTRSLAVEWGPHRIRVNAVAPGGTRTPRLLALRGLPPDAPPSDNRIGTNPLGRQGEMSDIAFGILFLASDMADQITGQVLVIDGGQTVNPYPNSIEGFKEMANKKVIV